MDINQIDLAGLVKLAVWAYKEGIVRVNGIEGYIDDPSFHFVPDTGKWVPKSRRKTKGIERPENDPTCYTFDEFYKDYDFPSPKKDAKIIWNKLPEEDRADIKEYLPYYLEDSLGKGETLPKNAPFIPTRQLATTFLNKRTWEAYMPNKNYKCQNPERYVKYIAWADSLGFTKRLSEQDFDSYVKNTVTKLGAAEAQRRLSQAHLTAKESVYKELLSNY